MSEHASPLEWAQLYAASRRCGIKIEELPYTRGGHPLYQLREPGKKIEGTGAECLDYIDHAPRKPRAG